jgi:asparagine synthase (glutamine-hydrolysing)
MCGICGIVEPAGHQPVVATLSRMNQALFHRGPDEAGQWTGGPAGLAMRRLAIIDLSGGHQPIFNEDGTVLTVFNGEIYNYHELREHLEGLGHRLATHSDTETIVHLYEQYGAEGIERLNGMFALALWDIPNQTLLLARDRAGKKPLYYSTAGGRLLFSSELASLLEYPGVSRELDPAALDNYFLYGYVPAPLTIFRDVRKLEPGCTLQWCDGQASIRRYWRLRPADTRFHDEEEAADELLRLLEDAVRIRLYSDVPFGALLSGGVDSSLVVGLMSRCMARPVQTFSIGFSDRDLDESKYAQQVATLFSTDHHTLRVDPPAVPDLLDRLLPHFGEPFADASAIPTFLVSSMARQHVTMVLSGDGGDEVFGGYRSYKYHQLIDGYRKLPAPLRAVARHGSRVAFPGSAAGSLPGRTNRFLQEAELPVDERWAHSRALFGIGELDELYTPGFASAIDPSRRSFHLQASFEYFRPWAGSGLLNQVDYETYMTDDVLVKVDRMSMAASLEVRSPLLDYRLAEFATALPRSFKWNTRETKRILKKAATRLLPAEILNRPKQGFVLPVSRWFRGELVPFVEEVFHRNEANGLIDVGYCRRLLEAHRTQGRGGFDRKLWSVLCFLLWREKFAR